MICPPIDNLLSAHKRQMRGFTSQKLHKARKMSRIVFTFATGIEAKLFVFQQSLTGYTLALT